MFENSRFPKTDGGIRKADASFFKETTAFPVLDNSKEKCIF